MFRFTSSVAVSLFAICYITVTAYEFDSLDFNKYLADELEYYQLDEETIPKLRFRREETPVTGAEKCKPRRKRLCCAENSMDEIHEKEKETKRECFKTVLGKEMKEQRDPFKCENMNKHKRDMICVMQCVGQKNEILDKDGKIQETEFAEFVKRNFIKDPWFGELQDQIIETCIKEAKNATSQWDNEKDSCNPAGIKLAHCLFAQSQLNCPVDQIKDSKSCSKLQERLKSKMNGKDGFQQPPPFLHDE